jgi:hypothetical protein
MTNDDIGKAVLVTQIVVTVDDGPLVRAWAEGLLRPPHLQKRRPKPGLRNSLVFHIMDKLYPYVMPRMDKNCLSGQTGDRTGNFCPLPIFNMLISM